MRQLILWIKLQCPGGEAPRYTEHKNNIATEEEEPEAQNRSKGYLSVLDVLIIVFVGNKVGGALLGSLHVMIPSYQREIWKRNEQN